MKESPDIVRIASLIGDHTRAKILSALMTGQALTATELAEVAGVTKQTVSTHLSQLLAAHLLEMTQQGRHKYFRLADDDVAHLLETLMGVAYRVGTANLRVGPKEPALRKSRVCYDHLAGEFGVLIFEGLQDQGTLRLTQDKLLLTTKGRQFFLDMDINVSALESQRRPLCRTCLDWSMRRYHLAGGLGKSILDHCLKKRWARRIKDSRVVTFSALGERELRKLFCRA